MKKVLYTEHILPIIVAMILLQTLWFKFNGAMESVYIFSTLGVEPWGRIVSGCVELVASILILLPPSVHRLRYCRLAGALLAAGAMVGALVAHIFVIGISVQGDNGLLFGLAVTVFICSIIVALREMKTITPLRSYWGERG